MITHHRCTRRRHRRSVALPVRDRPRRHRFAQPRGRRLLLLALRELRRRVHGSCGRLRRGRDGCDVGRPRCGHRGHLPRHDGLAGATLLVVREGAPPVLLPAQPGIRIDHLRPVCLREPGDELGVQVIDHLLSSTAPPPQAEQWSASAAGNCGSAGTQVQRGKRLTGFDIMKRPSFRSGGGTIT